VVSFTPWLFYPQKKSHWYPLDRRLGGLQSKSRHSREEEKFQPWLGIGPPNPAGPGCNQWLHTLS